MKTSKTQKAGAKKTSSKPASKFKTVILAIAIVVVLTFFIQVGIRTFFPEPEYQDFCKEERYFPEMIKAENCVFSQEAYEAAMESCEGYVKPKYNSSGCVASYECELCGKEFDTASEKHSNAVFWLSLIVGIIVFVIGMALKQAAVSSGLMGGAVLTLFIGITQNWRFMTDYARFAILGLALAILIWLGYKKLNK